MDLSRGARLLSRLTCSARKYHLAENDYRNAWCRFNCFRINQNPRNLPVVLKYAVSGAHERRQAFLEIEVLLGHLFRRNNMPVHVAKRLIPRFVTSTLSPSYIRSVVEAFRSERTMAKRILAVTAISVRRLRDSFTPRNVISLFPFLALSWSSTFTLLCPGFSCRTCQRQSQKWSLLMT